MALQCPAPLLPALTSGDLVASDSLALVCAGCAPGSAGVLTTSSCAPCAAGSICPGILAAPLPNSSAISALSLRAQPAWACSGSMLGISSGGAAQSVIGASASLATGQSVSSLNRALAGIIAAGVSIVAATFFGLAALFLRARGGDSGVSGPNKSEGTAQPTTAALRAALAAAFTAALKEADGFALRSPQRPGDVVRLEPSELGGACSVAAYATLAILAAVLALRRQADNVLVQQSLAILDAATSASAATTSWVPPAPTVGGQLRVRALVAGAAGAGELSCATPLSWSTAGLDAGAFIFSSAAAPCASFGGAAIFQLEWACSDCVLTTGSELAFSLPFSCQSLVLEAMATNAAGKPSVVASLGSEGSARSSGSAAASGLVSQVAWSALALLDVQSDERPGAGASASSGAGAGAPLLTRGYALLDGGTRVLRTPPSRGLNASSGLALISPLASAISVTIALPLQPYYSRTTLSEKMSIESLLANIIGLSGILSVFGMLFEQTDRRTRAAVALARSSGSWRSSFRRRSAVAKLSSMPVPAADPGDVLAGAVTLATVSPPLEPANADTGVANPLRAATDAVPDAFGPRTQQRTVW